MRQRSYLKINAGNFLEVVGAALGVYGLDRLAGFAWALILAAILFVVAAELIYDEHVWRVPLPVRPQPGKWVKARRQRIGLWRFRITTRWRAGRAK